MNCSREREKKLGATKTLYKVNRANPKRDNMVKICPINPSFSRVAGCNIHDLHLRNYGPMVSTPQNLIMVSGFGTQQSDSIIINVNPYLSVCLLAEPSMLLLRWLSLDDVDENTSIDSCFVCQGSGQTLHYIPTSFLSLKKSKMNDRKICGHLNFPHFLIGKQKTQKLR